MLLMLKLFFFFLCSVRVSNELGSGHPRAAKYSVIITVVQSLLIGLLSALLIMATRNKFAIIFTDSVEMQKGVASLAHLLGITMVLNSVQPVISGKQILPLHTHKNGKLALGWPNNWCHNHCNMQVLLWEEAGKPW